MIPFIYYYVKSYNLLDQNHMTKRKIDYIVYNLLDGDMSNANSCILSLSCDLKDEKDESEDNLVNELDNAWKFTKFKIHKSMRWLEFNIFPDKNNYFKIKINDGISFRIKQQSVIICNTKNTISDPGSLNISLTKMFDDHTIFESCFFESPLISSNPDLNILNIVLRFNQPCTMMRMGRYSENQNIYNTLIEIDITNGIELEINHHEIVIIQHPYNVSLYIDNIPTFQTDYLSTSLSGQNNQMEKFPDLKQSFPSNKMIFRYYDPFNNLININNTTYYSDIMYNVLDINNEPKMTEKPKRELLYRFLENNKENNEEIKIMVPSKSFCQFIEYLQGTGSIDEITIIESIGILFHAILYDCLDLIDLNNLNKKMLEYVIATLLDQQIYEDICDIYMQILGCYDAALIINGQLLNNCLENNKEDLSHRFIFQSDLMKHKLDSLPGSSDEFELRKELFDLLEQNQNEITTDSNVHSFVEFLNHLQSDKRHDTTNNTKNNTTYIEILFYALRYGCLPFFEINGRQLLSILLNIISNKTIYNTTRHSLCRVID